ncbi:glutathione S-transferase theta-1b isoform X1 [Alosa sapidissima]|uniref:glutathione S-transferase theta-1b isoform X1 n=1 Tax=Alosa sapidissima TaxID=34773 RepID=UPI001C0838B5|nr:glutathione S-transferase theta-1b isoform X1 [Alosa sapidissima]
MLGIGLAPIFTPHTSVLEAFPFKTVKEKKLCEQKRRCSWQKGRRSTASDTQRSCHVPGVKPAISVVVGTRIAIMMYLSEKFQTPDHWYPTDIQKRARVNEYLSWQHTAVRMHGTRVFWLRLMIPKMLGEEVPKDKMAAALEDLDGSLQLIEEKFLQDRPFIAGDDISLADLVAIVEIMQPVGSGLDVFEKRPKLSGWRNRVRAAIGPELFDEAHQIILSAQEMVKSMDGSTLQPFKPKILRLFL